MPVSDVLVRLVVKVIVGVKSFNSKLITPVDGSDPVIIEEPLLLTSVFIRVTMSVTVFATLESARKSLEVTVPEPSVIVLVVPANDALSHGEK